MLEPKDKAKDKDRELIGERIRKLHESHARNTVNNLFADLTSLNLLLTNLDACKLIEQRLCAIIHLSLAPGTSNHGEQT